MTDKNNCFNCKYQPDWEKDKDRYITTKGICKWSENNKIPACFGGGNFGVVSYTDLDNMSDTLRLYAASFKPDRENHSRDPVDIYLHKCECWEER